MKISALQENLFPYFPIYIDETASSADLLIHNKGSGTIFFPTEVGILTFNVLTLRGKIPTYASFIVLADKLVTEFANHHYLTRSNFPLAGNVSLRKELSP